MAEGSTQSKSSSSSKPETERSKSGGSKSPASANRSREPSGSRSSRDGRGNVGAVKDTVSSGVSSAGDAMGSAGSAVGDAAKKAKTPAIAGGAALAGLAGGIALASRGSGPRRVLGVPIPGTRKPLVKINLPTIKVKSPRGSRAKSVSKDILKAAEEVGSAGRSVSDLLGEVDRVRGALNGGRRRSPIEVVLEGLTSRGRNSRAD